MLGAFTERPFSELLLNPANGHRLEALQVPWANELLDKLRTQVSNLASVSSGRRVESSSSPTPEPPFEGWRCLICGHGEATVFDIERWVAKVVPINIADAGLGSERNMVERILNGNVDGAGEARSTIKNSALVSDIKVTDRSGILRPCPSCGAADTAVYRWVTGGETLQPADNNLAIREPGHRYRPSTDCRELIAALEQCGAIRIDPRVYELTVWRARDMLDGRTAILEVLRGIGENTFLVIYDDDGRATRDGWHAVGDYTWRLPQVASSRVMLQSTLETGLWQMYAAARPLARSQLPDLFGADLEPALAVLQTREVDAFIDSWGDNTEWRVALNLGAGGSRNKTRG